MRAARFATMLCCLLAFATSASAECAWVLWGQPHVLVYVSENRWRPLESFANQAACRAALRAHFALSVRGIWTRHEAPGFPEGIWEIGVCLPDTVNPMGAKEK